MDKAPIPAVLVFQPDVSEDPRFFGPFPSGRAACDFAHKWGWSVTDWYWEHLESPDVITVSTGEPT